jgi:hypothetical protein
MDIGAATWKGKGKSKGKKGHHKPKKSRQQHKEKDAASKEMKNNRTAPSGK